MAAFDIFPFAPRVPLLYLQTVVGDVVRTLKVMYGSLDRLVSLSIPVVLLRELAETSPLWLSFFTLHAKYTEIRSVFHQFKAPAGFYTKSSLSYYLNPPFLCSLLWKCHHSSVVQ